MQQRNMSQQLTKLLHRRLTEWPIGLAAVLLLYYGLTSANQLVNVALPLIVVVGMWFVRKKLAGWTAAWMRSGHANTRTAAFLFTVAVIPASPFASYFGGMQTPWSAMLGITFAALAMCITERGTREKFFEQARWLSRIAAAHLLAVLTLLHFAGPTLQQVVQVSHLELLEMLLAVAVTLTAAYRMQLESPADGTEGDDHEGR